MRLSYHQLAERMYRSRARIFERICADEPNHSRKRFLERLVTRLRSSEEWHRSRALAGARVPQHVHKLALKAHRQFTDAQKAKNKNNLEGSRRKMARYRKLMYAAGLALRDHLAATHAAEQAAAGVQAWPDMLGMEATSHVTSPVAATAMTDPLAICDAGASAQPVLITSPRDAPLMAAE
jgi:hypothetical protein